MRHQSALALIFALIFLVGCNKGIDIKRDVTFDFKKPIVVWYEPLTSEQKVHPFFRSTGFVADFFLIKADSEAQANQLVDQQLPADGFHLGWKFAPDPAITIGKVQDAENDGFDAVIPAGKGYAAVLYPTSRMPDDYAGTYKGFVWVANP